MYYFQHFAELTAVQVDNLGVGGWIFDGVDKFSEERPSSAAKMLEAKFFQQKIIPKVGDR